MAIAHITFFSNVLGMNVDMTAFIPENPTSAQLKTVYLLHGMSDNQTNWQRYTHIERFVAGKDVAVIMPTTHLAWYTDMECGYLRYYTFVSKEVPEVSRRMFPQLSAKREDNFIAGLSMGGYGALKIALANSDKFEKAASFSGAFGHVMADYSPYWNSIFGDTPEKRRKHTIEAYVKNAVDGNARKVPVYIWCGTEDKLLPASREARDLLLQNGYEVTYSESTGGHDWDSWESQFKKALEFFGL